jgi:regulator of sigma E protease
VSTWSEFQLKVLDQTLAKADAVTLTLRDSVGERQIRGLELDNRSHELSDADVLTQLGLRLFRPLVPPVIGTLQPGKPAAGAGLRVGDRVQTVDGNPVEDWAELVELVRQSSGEIVTLSLLRETALLTVAIRPERLEEGGKKIARIGVGPLRSGEPDARFQIIVRHDPVSALGDGVQRTASGAWLSLRMMGKMLIGELSWRNLSGPVTIADYAGKSARVSLVAYLSFLAMISISLGVLNLLPIPLLDGGHLMYYSAELLTGSPVPEKIAELGQKAGILVLGCLMAFAFFNDLNRLFSG